MKCIYIKGNGMSLDVKMGKARVVNVWEDRNWYVKPSFKACYWKETKCRYAASSARSI